MNVAEKCPLASVLPLNGPAGVAFAPLLFVSVIVTGSLPAATQPPPRPRFFSTKRRERMRLTNPVRLRRRDVDPRVDPGLRRPARSTHASNPCSASTDTPDTDSVVCALTTVTPGIGELIVVVHEPPVVEQPVGGFGVDAAVSLSIVNVTAVPSGAAVSPVPSFTNTFAVNVCVVPTRFVRSGAIVIRASTTRKGSHTPSEGSYSPSPL